MPAPYTPKNSMHKMFLHKLVHYHVPTQKPIDATLSPLSIFKKIQDGRQDGRQNSQN